MKHFVTTIAQIICDGHLFPVAERACPAPPTAAWRCVCCAAPRTPSTGVRQPCAQSRAGGQGTSAATSSGRAGQGSEEGGEPSKPHVTRVQAQGNPELP